MNDWLHSDLALRLGYVLLHSLWQGVAVCVAAWITLAVMRRSTAAARYAVALGAAVLMLLLPAGTFYVMQRSALEAPAATAGEGKPVAPEATAATGVRDLAAPARRPLQMDDAGAAVASRTSPALTWRERCDAALPYAVMIWLAGVLVLSARNVGGWIALQRLRRMSTTAASEKMPGLLGALQRRMGLTRPVRLLESREIETPMLLGFFKPLILFPPALAAGLSTGQLEAILAHELAHIRRHDYAAMLFQRLIETILFYHPGVWWLSRRINLEREQACDDVAAAISGDTRAYAAALGAIEEWRLTLPAVAASGSGPRELILRIARLLGRPGPREPRRNGVAWGVALATLALVAVLAVQPRHVVAADPPPQIAVTVKDLATGKPVQGALVKERGVNFEEVKTTDENGIVTLTRQANPKFATVSVSGAGWAAVSQRWMPTPQEAAPPDKMDFVLEPAKSIGGIVQDDASKPLANAKVMAYVSKAYAGRKQTFSTSFNTIETDAQGKWTLSGVPAQFDAAEIGAAHAECLENVGYIDITNYADHAALSAGTAMLTLKRGVPLNITVRDQDGKPAPGARVGFGQDRVASNSLPEFNVNAEGKLRLGIQRGVDAVITVYLPGHAPDLKRIRMDKEATLEFDMKEGKAIKGRVTGADGKGIAHAFIFLDTWRGARTLDQEPIYTDDSGGFIFDNAPDDEMKANVQAPGYMEQTAGLKPGAVNVVALISETVFTGTVVDAATGQPVKNFTARDGIDSKDGHPVNWFGQYARPEPTGKPGEFRMVFSLNYPAAAVRVEADGYKTRDSASFDLNGKAANFTFKLEKGEPVRGTLVTADGKPVKGVEIFLIGKDQYMDMDNGEPSNTHQFRSFKSSDAGELSFIPDKDPYLLLAVAKDLQVLAKSAAFEKSHTLVMTPWARIEGDVRLGTHPAPGTRLEADPEYDTPDEHAPRILARNLATADATGHFVFDHVIPGTVHITKREEPGTMTAGEKVGAKAGETAHIQIGGKGKPITGKIATLDDPRAKDAVFTMVSLLPQPRRVEWSPPVEVMEMPAKEAAAWRAKFDATDEGKQLQNDLNQFSASMMYNCPIAADGTFRINEVLPGKYFLRANLNQPAPLAEAQRGSTGPTLGAVYAEVVVPEIPAGVSDDPLILGTFQPHLARALEVGDAVPEFKLDTLDGKTISSADIKGKTVLVLAWATYAREYLPDVTLLKDLAAAHKDDGRLVIICLNDDYAPGGAKKYADAKGLPGIQVQANPRAMAEWRWFPLQPGKMPPGPVGYVINADGKLAAIATTSADIKAAVGRSLGK